ncbi:MAG: hypothetical protein R3A48_25835 [Polyangiales bacterium]
MIVPAGALLVALLPMVPENVAAARGPVILNARLRADVVDLAAVGAHLGQSALTLAQPSARRVPVAQPPAQPPAPVAAPTPPPAADDACAADREACQESEQIARNVLRHRERSLRTHRAFGIAAWSSMLVTEILGTIQIVNQDSWFGRGACASNPDAFGCRQSSLITGLHEGFAFTTVGLYLTAGIIGASAADPERASEGDGAAQRRLRLHKTLAWIHGAGMVLLPLLGVISAYPQIVGATSNEARADVGRAMRTLHAIVGYSTFTAFTIAAAIEL